MWGRGPTGLNRARLGRAALGVLAASALVGAVSGTSLAAPPRHAVRRRPPSFQAELVRHTFSAYGKVDTVSGQAFVLTLNNGNLLAINVPIHMVVREGLAVSSLSQMQAGDYAVVGYHFTSGGLVARSASYDTAPMATGPVHVLLGRVAATGSGSFTLTLASGRSIQVAEMPGAVFHSGAQLSSAASLAVGDFARVEVRSGNGVTDALSVQFAPGPVGLRIVRMVGTVTAAGASSLTLTTRSGASYAVTVPSNTVVSLAGATAAAASIPTGSSAVVLGSRFEGVFYAARVTATPPLRSGAAVTTAASGGGTATGATTGTTTGSVGTGSAG